MMRTLACAACLLGAVVCSWLLQKVARTPLPQPPADDGLPPLPFPDDDVLWLVCDTPECAHLETPHHRVGDGLVACCWCIRLSSEPTTPKDTAQ